MEIKYKFGKVFNALAVSLLTASSAFVAISCGGENNAEGEAPNTVVEQIDTVSNADASVQEATVEDVSGEVAEQPTSEGTPVENAEAEKKDAADKKETAKAEAEKKDAVDKKETAKVDEKRVAKEINDADGWTCVRTEPNAKSKEKFRVQAEKKFYVSKIEGSKWCKFYWTEDGKQEGYIHGSFIKNVGEKKTAINEYKPTGKYHVIIGSFDDYQKAKAKFEQIDKWADADMFFEKNKKMYRVAIYSSTDKSKAENVKADVAKDGYPDAWILKY